MKTLLAFVLTLSCASLLQYASAEQVKPKPKFNGSALTKSDLDTAGTIGFRRRHFGYGGHGHGWGQFYNPRPSFGKIIITYPKYYGHGGYGHGHYGGHGHHGHGHYGHGHGHYGHGHGHRGFKKGGFYPSQFLGPIMYGHGGYGGGVGIGTGLGYGWNSYY